MQPPNAITPPLPFPGLPAANTDNKELAAVLAQLSYNQIRFCIAMLQLGANPSKSDAAVSIGLRPDTVQHWPAIVDRALELLALDALASARALMRGALTKAVMVKIAGLDSNNAKIAQQAATEIIEWQLGRAKQSVDVAADVGVYDHRDNVYRKLFENIAAGFGEGTPGDSE